jgi:hypothetical protein
VPDLSGAQLLRVRREAKVGVDLLLREQPLALDGRMLDEVQVLARIQPYVRHHAGEVHVLGQPQFSDRDRLALQVPDRANPVRPEQLETSHVHAAQDRDGGAGVQLDDQRPDEVHRHIDFP